LLTTLVLFRDLEETVYLAGCPVSQEKAVSQDHSAQNDADKSTVPEGPRFDPEDLRDCSLLEAGQTFSTQVEGDTLRIVTRGRQLALRIFTVQEKPRTTDTPYVPSPSRSLDHTGPQTRRRLEGLEPQSEPRWEPPDPRTSSGGKPSSRELSGVPPAKTSLRTGRLTIDCASRRAFVLIDGAYVGSCPATLPLIAGPHTVVIRTPGRRDQVRDIRIEGGQTRRIRLR
jgi:hypothetical protein